MNSSKESAGVDKQGLWGWWHGHQKWVDRLHRKAAHKALDIEDDMSVNSFKGVDGGTLLGIGAMNLLGPFLGAAIAVGALWFLTKQDKEEPSIPPPVTSPVDAGYEVLFYDAQGNQVRLDRWPGAVPTPQD